MQLPTQSTKTNQHVEILRSNVPGLSSMSQASCDFITAVLSKHYTQVGVTTVNNFSDLESLVNSQPDLVFLGMKYVPKDDSETSEVVWITDYLDAHNIAYTGSGHHAHELELNKQLAKQRVLDHGLSTSDFYVAQRNQPQHRKDMVLNFPLFVKPTNRGGGLGIDNFSVARNFDELESKVLSIATNFQSDSLVESYLTGREFSVAILKGAHADEYSLMPLELIAPFDSQGARILSAEVKSADTETFVEVTDEILKTKLTTLAINVFHALGARDYGRIDIRLDSGGTPHFLEANLIPSLLKNYGNFPKACLLNMNMNYDNVILNIAQLGLIRNRASQVTAPA